MPERTPPHGWRRVRLWVRRIWIVGGLLSFVWLWWSFSAHGLPDGVLESSDTVVVRNERTCWSFLPQQKRHATGLIFFPGGGVEATAYAPLARRLAEHGHVVHIVKLPWRLAPLDSHLDQAIRRAEDLMTQSRLAKHWVVGGHSRGAVISCRMAAAAPAAIEGLLLIGSTHPKRQDLSWLACPVAKVYATRDGVATADAVRGNANLLPAETVWVRIEGGNHSQFGYYGPQLRDRRAAIDRREQQDQTARAILQLLARVAKHQSRLVAGGLSERQ